MAKTLLTKEGLNTLQAELKKLKEEDRARVIEELKDARAQGDLSENADYDAARNKQAQIENRIAEIEAIISNHEIITENKKKGKVVNGSTVTVKDLSRNEIATYTIVGPVEANPANGKISNESPVALAIMNCMKGDKVIIKVKKPYEIEIIEIK